ncbi:MAG: ABC transporter ATP-binding protein [Clostridia bacterium]|nr:ABC transporter ATP-binding protein [Clostridia bacterium]
MKKIIKSFEYSYKCISFMWKKSKGYFLLTIISIIVNSIQAFPGMYLVSYSIDLLTNKVDFNKYLRIIGFIVGLMLLTSILSMLINSILEYSKKKFYTKIRQDINYICLHTDYEKIQSKSFIEEKDFALSALNNDSLELYIQSVKTLISSIIVIAGTLYIISFASLFILIPLAITIILISYNSYLNCIQNYVETKEEIEYGKKSTYLQSISRDFSYAKEIRAFDLKDKFKKRMDEVAELLLRIKENRRKKRRPSNFLVYSAEAILQIAIYLYFGYKVFASIITLGQFSLYSNAVEKLKSSLENIMFVVTEFMVNTEYVQGFFNFMKTNVRTLKHDKMDISSAKIEFKGVSYKYPKAETYALKDVNLSIDAGETLLIVGENGAGKSTFIKLLCGLYKPTEGRILINGIDISTIDSKEYVKNISAVFQDYKLFALSIADNIDALKDFNSSKMDKSLEQVNLLEKVRLSNGVDTQLYRIFDENGCEFSGGEMQRLAIARAIYKDAPILVLDEPTSALDPKVEYEIYNSFKQMSENRTAVYISHRLSSIKFSDKIAVFDKGEIVEYGTHDDLIAKKGIYEELYSIQASLYHREEQQ